MSDSARDLLTRGIAAAKSNEPKQAKKYLLWSLRNRPDPRQQVDALYWLARLSEGEEQEGYLLQVLQVEPSHYAARRDLAVLRGELQADDLVDPTDPELPQQPEQIDANEQRFDCPQCGGRMEYDAAQRQLLCRYCDHRATPAAALREGSGASEADFIQALATAKGHLHPQSMTTFECEACGATLPDRSRYDLIDLRPLQLDLRDRNQSRVRFDPTARDHPLLHHEGGSRSENA